MSESPHERSRLYSARFAETAAYRNRVWAILTERFFSRWIRPSDTVLDLGCGGEVDFEKHEGRLRSLPWLWWIQGRPFLVVARKPSASLPS